MALDSAGDVYVADSGDDAMKEILALNGSIPATPTVSTIAGGLSGPAGVAIDGLGNVYVAERGNDAVEELTVASGFANVSRLGTGFGGPSGIAVDSGGNVYVGSASDAQVVKLDYADPPTLNFEAGAGSTSAPQTVTFTNYGNADLTFASPSSGYNPSVSKDFTIETNESAGSPCPILSASSGAATLAAGGSCTDQLTFGRGAGGDVSGSMAITDNEFNVAKSTQTILLNGTSVSIALAPASLEPAQVGAAYSQAVTANGGVAPYIFQMTSGALPAGIALDSSGLLSGTPSAAGSFSFGVSATDANGISGSKTYAMTVGAPAITIDPSSLLAAQVNVGYSQVLTASGGTAPYSYKVTGGALPAGLTLSSSGVLSGTPTASGSFAFTVTATDSSTGTGAPFPAIGSFSLTVNAPAITIAPAALPSGQDGIAYTLVSLAASGGTAPYSYKVTAGAMPPGLMLNSAGVLSGTPTAGGSFIFTVTATDANRSTGNQAYSMTISAPSITIAPSSLSTAQAGVAYSQTLTAAGGTAPYSYKVTGGALPAGLTFDAATATFSGTPATGGSYSITVTVTDSSTGSGPYTSSANYTLAVNRSTAPLTFATIPPQTYGNPPFTISASSASTGTITYSIVAGPASIDPATRMVTLTGAGEVTLEASQAATAAYSSAVAQMPISVAKQGSITAIAAGSSTVAPGQSTTLTATVTPSVAGNPTGTVSFFDGGTQIGTAVTLTNGIAQLVASNLSSGQHEISAVYSGDGNFLGSSSTLPSSLVVSASDFSFTATGNTSQTVKAGGTATFNFALAPDAASYPGTVTFSLDGLPSGANGSISVTSVPSTGGPQTITLAITVGSGNSASIAPPNMGRGLGPLALALLLPFLGLSGLGRRNRKLFNASRVTVLLAAGALTILPLSGCGSVSGVLGHSYSVAVAAKAGTVQHTAFVNITISN